jgi:hypothetical protein
VIVLDMFSDTDYAGCVETRRAMTCGQYFTDGQPIYGFARRQGVQSTSSGEAELYGASSVAFDGRLIKELFEWLGFEVVYNLHTDSSSAKSMINRDGVGGVKHLDVRALWLQQEREKNGLKVRKVAGERNPADLGTKAHPQARFDLLKQLCGIADCSEIDSATEVGIHSIESWGARPKAATSGRSFVGRLAVLSTILLPAKGDSMTIYKGACEVPGINWTLVFFAVLGWALAFLVAWCWCRRSVRHIAVSGTRKQKKRRNVGTQTTTTFRRRYAAPRMGELADGEHGVWID